MRRIKADTPVSASEAARAFAPLTGAGRVVLAVSGGPDSTALMGLFAEAAGGLGVSAIVATVDHGLRAQSAAEAEAVGVAARGLGLQHETLVWRGEKPNSGIQEAARDARYRLLTDFARDTAAKRLLTAHTLDDQAETVLMRLLRGSGLKGLGGMAAATQVQGITLFRPFLDVPKSRLVATCAARHWRFITDPANANPVFMRARLRKLSPLLDAEGLTTARLSTLAQRMQRADLALEAQTGMAMRDARRESAGVAGYEATSISKQPMEIVVRVFAALLTDGGASAPVRLERIERIAADFVAAVQNGETFSRNLGGLQFKLQRGLLISARERARRGLKLTAEARSLEPLLGNGPLHP